MDEKETVCSGTFNYRVRINGSHSSKQGCNLVVEIVFKYVIGTTSYKYRL